MFNERMALKLRLEQLENTEIRLLKELREERERLFKKLRELDEKDRLETNKYKEIIQNKSMEAPQSKEEKKEISHKDSPPLKIRKARPSRRSKTSKMCEVAIQILKEETEPIRGTDLQKKIEEKSGLKIANMTTFMKVVEKVDINIQKPNRGLYLYVNNGQKAPVPN